MRDHAAACLNRLLYLKPYYQNKRRNTMNPIIILLAFAFALFLGFLIVQGIRVIRYSLSEEWKLQKRIIRFVKHEAN
jgi:hypothetical protein